jgi:hypothetical protein
MFVNNVMIAQPFSSNEWVDDLMVDAGKRSPVKGSCCNCKEMLLKHRLTIIHITTSKRKRTKEITENIILWQFRSYFVFRGNVHVCNYILKNLMQTLRHGAKQTIKNGIFHSIGALLYEQCHTVEIFSNY